MATVRQSILSFGYVVILLPRIKDGAEVLNQRSIQQSRKKLELEQKIKSALVKYQELDDDEVEQKATA